MPKRIPAAVKSQLHLQRVVREAARPREVPVLSQDDKDLKAELDAICDPVSRRRLSLRPGVEAVTFRSTARDRPEGPARFFLETWSRMIYANTDVRFNVHLHYYRSHLLAENRDLEARAAKIEQANAVVLAKIASIQEARTVKRRRKAKELGVTESEMENVSDAEDDSAAASIEAHRQSIIANEARAASLRGGILPLERLDGEDRVVDHEEARALAVAQAKSEPHALSAEGSVETMDVQVAGPLTPPHILRALRADSPIQYPVRHCLEVHLRCPGQPSTEVQTVDLPLSTQADHIALLLQAGLLREPGTPPTPTAGTRQSFTSPSRWTVVPSAGSVNIGAAVA